MNQLELHKKIDKTVGKNPDEIAWDNISALISDEEAKNYFFFRVDESWIEELWANGVLDVLKKGIEGEEGYGFRTPEINYLVRVAKKHPEKVITILLKDEIATSQENARLELIDQALSICSDLPVDQLKRIIPKMKEQGWARTMSKFSHRSFLYEEMLKTLDDADEYDSLLLLSEEILTMRSKEEMDNSKEGYHSTSPFYIGDLSQVSVFKKVVEVEGEHAERAFSILTRALSQEAHLGDTTEEKSMFSIEDSFSLYDVDFFSIKLGEKTRLSSGDDVRELAAAVANMAEKIFSGLCDDTAELNRYYEKYIGSFSDEGAPLPNTQALWRLRLYILSLCPESFVAEIRKSLRRIFDATRNDESYHDLVNGTEYQKLLMDSFDYLEASDRSLYVEKIIAFFESRDKNDESDDGKLARRTHLKYAGRILSMIKDSEEVRDHAQHIKEIGITLSDEVPSPMIHASEGLRNVVPQGIISSEEFHKLSIDEIVDNLKDEWTPEKLNEYNDRHESGDSNTSRPFNAEGTGKLLEGDVSTRLNDYVEKASMFLDIENLDPHYTNAFLSGVEAAVKEKKVAGDWSALLTLLVNICETKETQQDEERTRGHHDTYLFDWKNVYMSMTNVMRQLLNERDGETSLDTVQYRSDIISILKVLLAYPSPTPANEESIEDATMTVTHPGREKLISDPHSMAINTVRGRAFEVFVMFIYQDGKELQDQELKIMPDVKKMYEEVLTAENTRALMFMFGRHIPTFHFRDREWINGLLPIIFPVEDEKKYLYLAAWEGYLTQTLYKEVFIDEAFQQLYFRGIESPVKKYPNQESSKDVEEALADHLALAFVHFQPFDKDNALFVFFWEKASLKSRRSFIQFIGRHVLSRADAQGFVSKGDIDIEKIKDFWTWVLEADKEDTLYEEFGFWINKDENVLGDDFVIEKMAATLQKSKGVIEWDYALVESLVKFAKINPKKTLDIIKAYLLEGDDEINEHRRTAVYVDREIKDALSVIYGSNESAYKQPIANLIEILIRKGGRDFWTLKDILDEVSSKE